MSYQPDPSKDDYADVKPVTTELINITFPNGIIGVIESHIFADMLNAYQNRLYDRQKEAQQKLVATPLFDVDNRDCHIQTAIALYDDANVRLHAIENVERAFKKVTT